MTKPLSIDDLYTDTGTFDQQKVLSVLQSKIAFTRDNEILFTMDPTKIKTRDVIILYALAKKVLKSNSKIENEVITNAELLDKTKINKNTVNVTIMRLKKKKLLLASGSGYELPMFKVNEAVSLLSDNKTE
jgi:hypothetical protein